MESFELGSDRKRGSGGPGAGAAGAAVLLLVLTSAAYLATGSLVQTALAFGGMLVLLVAFDRLYGRIVP